MIYFISGHLSLTSKEFDEHYAPKIDDALDNATWFVVGDARGADAMAQAYLHSRGLRNVTVFHMFENPRNNAGDFSVLGGFHSDGQRDAAMTAVSVKDIAWVRSGREESGTALNLKRRTQ